MRDPDCSPGKRRADCAPPLIAGVRPQVPTYRVLVQGRNCLIRLDGDAEKHGFFQTVFVREADPDLASAEAVRIVKADAELQQLLLNDPSDLPAVNVDTVEEIPESAVPGSQVTGRTYFREKAWWQFWR